MSDGAVFSRSPSLYRRWAMAADVTASDGTPSNADETEERSEAARCSALSVLGWAAERRESPPSSAAAGRAESRCGGRGCSQANHLGTGLKRVHRTHPRDSPYAFFSAATIPATFPVRLYWQWHPTDTDIEPFLMGPMDVPAQEMANCVGMCKIATLSLALS